MNDPHQRSPDATSKYRAMESAAFMSAVALSVVAVIANIAYPSSLWFIIASAIGGALVFVSWRSAVMRPESGNVFVPILAIAIMVLGLLAEIERPLAVNFACGLSIVGAVMFISVEVARRRSRRHTRSSQS